MNLCAFHLVQNYCMCQLHRGSYISAHVLLNLLNELGKRDKISFCRKTLYFCHYVRNVVLDVITFPVNL